MLKALLLTNPKVAVSKRIATAMFMEFTECGVEPSVIEVLQNHAVCPQVLAEQQRVLSRSRGNQVRFSYCVEYVHIYSP
jgi:hypothetical protein